ncbi:hypothetical protein BKA70DRAFT_1427703 [Coprinopsis sp. MPI-PUGE-AT-0042]|nr:hypothetical protein BKA70DRAFT_1448365 [Coprinopsis sp. MPI-PUGE-AT-0042]KAH6907873.1 hypothetical protein BKA70DRAFT_1427703 [Coprinopsis sp. MPI-PUGE-AT-0042]
MVDDLGHLRRFESQMHFSLTSSNTLPPSLSSSCILDLFGAVIMLTVKPLFSQT